jgi:hypothetical protein
MRCPLESLVGPRVPIDELRQHRLRYLTPNLLLGLARVLLLISIFVPYWTMDLDAPQYPDGLQVVAYVNHLEGDVKEINGLNHYIGMRPLEEAAQMERATAVWLIIAMFLLVEGAAFIHTKWAVLLALPAVLFPLGFLVDLHFWLTHFGQHLDPQAPLSNSVKPFSPSVLGESKIGQFSTIASAGWGLYLAAAGSLLTIAGFYFHRRAYKPLVERQATETRTSSMEKACAA